MIEDDPASIALLTLHLQGAGFEVAVARDGAEGLEMARQIRPAGIVLDLLLPKVDGWDVLARAKADPALREIPIVVVSMMDERGRGFALGATDYLLKPIDAATLLGTLRRVIRTIGGSAADTVTLLAVDDDPMAIELLRASLEPAGFAVLTAGDGAEGLEMARLAQPDLIILDLMMPEMDGFVDGGSVAGRRSHGYDPDYRADVEDDDGRGEGRAERADQPPRAQGRLQPDRLPGAGSRTLPGGSLT